MPRYVLNAHTCLNLYESMTSIQGRTEGQRTMPWRRITGGGAPKSSNNVVSTFFNIIHLLPKDLRFEHGDAKLVSCSGRHLMSVRSCLSLFLIALKPCTGTHGHGRGVVFHASTKHVYVIPNRLFFPYLFLKTNERVLSKKACCFFGFQSCWEGFQFETTLTVLAMMIELVFQSHILIGH